MTTGKSIPSVSVTYAQNGRSTRGTSQGARTVSHFGQTEMKEGEQR